MHHRLMSSLICPSTHRQIKRPRSRARRSWIQVRTAQVQRGPVHERVRPEWTMRAWKSWLVRLVLMIKLPFRSLRSHLILHRKCPSTRYDCLYTAFCLGYNGSSYFFCCDNILRREQLLSSMKLRMRSHLSWIPSTIRCWRDRISSLLSWMRLMLMAKNRVREVSLRRKIL